MKKINLLFAILLMAAVLPVSAKAKTDGVNLKRMDKNARTEYLIDKSNEVLKNYAPSWIRTGSQPSVSKKTKVFRERGSKYSGRKFYTVTYPCNDEEKAVGWDFRIAVDLWADDGEPKDIHYGDNSKYGVSFVRYSYQEALKEDAGRLGKDSWGYPHEMIEDMLNNLSEIKFSGKTSLKAGDEISGIVLDEDGKPMEYADVVEKDQRGKIVAHAYTDASGAFKYTLVNPQNSIEVSYAGRKNVSSSINANKVNVTLKEYTIYEP